VAVSLKAAGGRPVAVPRAALSQHVALFGFHELCGTAVGAADYLTIAKAFHTVFLEDVPTLGVTDVNVVRRFITLVDALYEANVKLVVHAAAPPMALLEVAQRPAGGDEDHGDLIGDKTYVKRGALDEVFAFDRTVSRLVEMSGKTYLSQAIPAHGTALLEEVLVGADAYGVVERLFNEYDVDGSGAIDEDELHAFLSDVSELSRGHRNVSRAELRAVLEEIDGNGDGQVDLEELRVYVAGAGTVELIAARVGLPTR